MPVDSYEMSIEADEKSSDIEGKLLALEKGGNQQMRESYRAEVRSYQNYLVPFRVDENGSEEVFKISNLYKIESIPIFISEEVYFLFQNDHLEKPGQIDELKQRGETLTLKTLTAEELFELIPPTPLGALFVLSGNQSELLFNFNLAEVFTDCFHQNATDSDLDYLTKKEDAAEKKAEINVEDNPNSIEAVKESAQRKIEERRKFRKLFAAREWIVLISQPTKNKLLKGEFSRDDFDLDRYGDKRIFIFSDAAALEDYKNATAQTEEKLYSIKVDSQRLFGSDLSEYDVMFVNPHSSDAAQIGAERFRKLNESFSAFEIESKLFEIDNARKNSGHYLGMAEYYVDVKEFQKFILPIDAGLKNAQSAASDFSIDRVYGISENTSLPVFTAEDCFEAFRLGSLGNHDPEGTNFMEPYFIDGRKLFQTLIRIKARHIIINPNGPVDPLDFEPNFALKVYCA